MIAIITSQSHHPQRDFECDFEYDTPKLGLSTIFRCCEQPAADKNNAFEGISKELKLDFRR